MKIKIRKRDRLWVLTHGSETLMCVHTWDSALRWAHIFVEHAKGRGDRGV